MLFKQLVAKWIFRKGDRFRFYSKRSQAFCLPPNDPTILQIGETASLGKTGVKAPKQEEKIRIPIVIPDLVKSWDSWSPQKTSCFPPNKTVGKPLGCGSLPTPLSKTNAPLKKWALTMSDWNLTNFDVRDAEEFCENFIEKIQLSPEKELVQCGRHLVNISTGATFVRNEEDFEDKLGPSIPKPYLELTKESRKLYYLSAFLIEHAVHLEKPSKIMLRILDASIYLAQGKIVSVNNGCLQEPVPSYSPFLEVGEFCGSEASLLAKMWIHATKESGQQLIVVGDQLDDPSYYVYTASVPTYQRLSQSEVISLFLKWEINIFRNVPAKLDSPKFALSVLTQLGIIEPVTIEAWNRTKLKLGLGFKNGFLELVEGEPKPRLVEYSASIVSGENIIPSDYTHWVTLNDEVMLQQTTLDFLKVLTNENQLRYNIIRGFLRRLLTTRKEGRHSQSALYIYGAGGTGKSLHVELFKQLVANRENIQEFSRDQNQFTSSQLASCELLIVSDLIKLTPDLVGVLKRILGRDSLTKEEKNKRGISVIEPSCQVVFVSNFAPDSFPLIAGDPAIMQKLIIIKMEDSEVIPAALQVANLRDTLSMFIPDIINWAMTAPESLLRNSVRGEIYQSFLTEEKSEVGIAPFLETNVLLTDDKNKFLPILDLAARLTTYIKSTGEDSLNTEAGFSKKQLKLATAVIEGMKSKFGIILAYTRYTKAGTDRPMGFFGLALMPRVGPIPPGCKLLVRKKASELYKLEPILKSKDIITWISPARQIVEANTLKILAHRDYINKQRITEYNVSQLEDKISTYSLMTPYETPPFDKGIDKSLSVDHSLSKSEVFVKEDSTFFQGPTTDEQPYLNDKAETPIIRYLGDENSLAFDLLPPFCKKVGSPLPLTETSSLTKDEGEGVLNIVGGNWINRKDIQEFSLGHSTTKLEPMTSLLSQKLTPDEKLRINGYIDAYVFKVPQTVFSFEATSPCSFSSRGELMIKALIEVAPDFARIFNRLFDSSLTKETQKIKLEEKFLILKKQFLQDQASEREAGTYLPSKGKPYFETYRKFTQWVPSTYKTTAAPRLSATGNTFHGMKKSLRDGVLEDFTRSRPSLAVVDIDMGACHACVCASLMGPGNILSESLEDTSFWDKYAQKFLKNFKEAKVYMTEKVLRGLLKIALYTSMNGGKPCNPARVLNALELKGGETFGPNNIKEGEIVDSPLFRTVTEVFLVFRLINEVQNLNTQVSAKQPVPLGEASVYHTYALNKITPYELDSAHKGISRVLQSYEVILLTVLVRACLKFKALPLSLDHDGLICIREKEEGFDSLDFAKKVELEMKPWFEYLNVPQIKLAIKSETANGVTREVNDLKPRSSYLTPN